ncbi:MAG: ABC transporter permease [Sphingomonas hengshuiensis]|uniref:ABC transporter permease n=1 Tax=Sphingomonas hengshuiensis TaxID=1609977 RepID=A0A2W4Z985_9SPHN|nr:MAG: ABC transporter permease [Sphingomonas hengshuiensis]
MIARGVVTAYLLFLLAPVVMLAIGAFGGLWVATPLPEGVTLRWVDALFADPVLWRALATSATVALGALAVNLAIVPPLAGALAVRPGPMLALVELLVRTGPVAVPSGVLGFALVAVLAGPLSPLQGSLAVLIAAHAVLALPYMLAPVLADLGERDAAGLLRMATSLGAGPVRGFVTIVLPAARGGLIAGTAAVVAVSIGEFQLTNLVAGFLNRTYPLLVADGFQRATGYACAATLPLVLLAFANALAGRSIGRPKEQRA